MIKIKTLIALLLGLVIISGCITPSTRESGIDSDKDGLSDAEELALGTNPNNSDTDGDGIKDAEDIDPLNFNLPTETPLPTTTLAPTTTPTTTTPTPITTVPPTTTPAPTTTPPTTTPPTQNLVLLVGFDENRSLFEGTIFDLSGLGNNGTLSGLGNDINWTVGQVGSALNFDGVNDIVNFGSPSVLDFDTSPYTISLWMNPTDSSSGRDIIAKTNYPYGWDVVLADINSTHLSVEALCGRSQTGSGAYIMSYYEPRLEWNHIVFKRNASGGYIYINGKYSWDPTGGNSLSECANAIASAPGTDMIIGYGPTYYEGYFNGSIDEVAIFNRSLTDDEIKAIYSSTQYFTVDITPPTTTPPPTTPPSEVEIQRDELVYTTPSGAKFYRATGSDGLTQPLAVDGVLPVSDDPIYTMAAGDFDGK